MKEGACGKVSLGSYEEAISLRASAMTAQMRGHGSIESTAEIETYRYRRALEFVL